MKALIIGGGVAGPALALELARRGHAVEIFDKVAAPAPGEEWVPPAVGGSVIMNENIMRAIKHLGLLDEVTAVGSTVVRNQLGRFDGTPFAVFPTFDGDEFKTTGALRNEIARIINSAMNAAGVTLQLSKKLVKIDQPADGGVTAHFEDGSSAHGDILIGADGINSAVRTLLFPDVKLKKSQYNGYFAVSPLNGTPAPSEFTVLLNGSTGNSAFTMPSGDEMIYWGMYESRPQGNEYGIDVWDFTNDLDKERERMVSLVEKWKLPKHFHEFAQRTARVININFAAVPPMPKWHDKNCLLVGDSAHGLFPFIGQGAGMSLEDVVVLPLFLDRLPDDPQRAFELFHEFRAPRTDFVAATSEALGKRTTGSGPVNAALLSILLKMVAFVSRATRTSFFNDTIVRYDCKDAAVAFL
ncbi:hypothetical protein HK405_011339, partial [Cladochytrium tenue]